MALFSPAPRTGFYAQGRSAGPRKSRKAAAPAAPPIHLTGSTRALARWIVPVARLALRLDGDRLPLVPGRQARPVVLGRDVQRSLAEEDPQRRLLGINYLQDRGPGRYRVTPVRRGRPVPGHLANRIVGRVLRTAPRGRARPVGAEPAWLDKGHCDPEPGDLLRERLGQPLQRPLGRVIGADGGEGTDAADARYLDDVPGALGPHDRQGGLGDPESAEDIRLQLGADLLLGELLDRAEVPVAGVVDHNLESAEVLGCRGDRS